MRAAPEVVAGNTENGAAAAAAKLLLHRCHYDDGDDRDGDHVDNGSCGDGWDGNDSWSMNDEAS